MLGVCFPSSVLLASTKASWALFFLFNRCWLDVVGWPSQQWGKWVMGFCLEGSKVDINSRSREESWERREREFWSWRELTLTHSLRLSEGRGGGEGEVKETRPTAGGGMWLHVGSDNLVAAAPPFPSTNTYNQLPSRTVASKSHLIIVCVCMSM